LRHRADDGLGDELDAARDTMSEAVFEELER
jgi:hypothetical protein